ERAKADGRWDRAYAGAANATMPEDLLAAIAAVPEAQASYEALNATSRFALYFRVTTAHSAATREKRIAALGQRLAAGEALSTISGTVRAARGDSHHRCAEHPSRTADASCRHPTAPERQPSARLNATPTTRCG